MSALPDKGKNSNSIDLTRSGSIIFQPALMILKTNVRLQ
jgi:hypothetical protein